jgi:hypothetical protein
MGQDGDVCQRSGLKLREFDSRGLMNSRNAIFHFPLSSSSGDLILILPFRVTYANNEMDLALR